MSPASRSVGPCGGRRALEPILVPHTADAARTRSAATARHAYQLPLVRELPRRWDALVEAEVVLREPE
jgi:hypothetical protein